MNLCLDFDRGGATYDAALDYDRLNRQQARVYEVMRDGHWRTLRDISLATGDPEASVSARLRDFRKLGATVERIRRDGGGTWLYRLEVEA